MEGIKAWCPKEEIMKNIYDNQRNVMKQGTFGNMMAILRGNAQKDTDMHAKFKAAWDEYLEAAQQL